MIEEKEILFFDTECLLCNKTVQWILKHEKDNTIYFCSLYSAGAKQFIPDNFKGMDSVIFYKKGNFYIYFDAFIKIIPHLKWYWKFLYLLYLIPPLIRKKFYLWIAANRKKWFGTTEICVLNSLHLNKRMLY